MRQKPFFLKLAKRSADKSNDFINDTTFNAVFQRKITLLQIEYHYRIQRKLKQFSGSLYSA